MNRPILLVFTRGARREARDRRLLPARLEALERRLHSSCLSSVLQAGRDAGCRITVSSPRRLRLPAGVHRIRQIGRGFGERLRHAIRQAAERTAGPVLLVGADVPGLRARHLRQANARLRQDPDIVVVGPSPDGGFYLLASRRPLHAQLRRVRWRCSRTLSSLLRELRRDGMRVHLLEPLQDLDRPQDLEQWAARAPAGESWRALVGSIRRALVLLKRAAGLPTRVAPSWIVAAVAGIRAPPTPA